MNSEHDKPGVDHELLPRASEPAIRRNRDRPMWGCVRGLFGLGCLVFLLLFLGGGGLFWYVGSTNFADLIRRRIESTLEARLGRDVTIGKLTFVRGSEPRVILDDLRIANVPGASNPYFATVRQVELIGGIDSFWFRQVKIGRVDIRDPHLYFEVFPDGSPLTHNFPQWKSGPPSRFEIVRIDVSRLFVQNGTFDFNDRKHDLRANVSRISAEVSPSIRKQIYSGVMTSPSVVVKLQDYLPFAVNLRGGFNFVPNSLELHSVALRGQGIEAFLSGKVDPLSEVVYNLNLQSRIELARVRQIFRIDKTLDGSISISGLLSGKQGTFDLRGKYAAPHVQADAYELSELKGALNIDDRQTSMTIEQGRYGGGNVTARYLLSRYSEPYPMQIHLGYDRISLEQLFSDWSVENTGLRGAATGALDYSWNKDRVLDGKGAGLATLSPGSVAFSGAKYVLPIRGKSRFALNHGVVLFRDSSVSTPQSDIAFTGSLRIENLDSDLSLDIHSRDFAELDQIGYNFAHSAGKKDYTLLGIGGSGQILGTVRGPISKAPQVVAHVEAARGAYRNVVIGDGTLDLSYDGRTSVLTFSDARFRDGPATLAMRGTISFPNSGPSPRFDLDIDATGYSVPRAMQIVGLDLKVSGDGTGHLHVSGTPDNGAVRFDHLKIVDGPSVLNLNGSVAWLPGKGNTNFDLDIGAQQVPVQTIVRFLDLGAVPATGDLNGTLHLSGPKNRLEGAGSIILRNGSLADEPIDQVTADLLFTAGKLHATNVEVQSPAGKVSGEFEYDLATDKFGYLIKSADVDVAKVKALATLGGLITGTLHVTSTGAGTMASPELVVEGTLENAQIRGITLPPDTAAPTFYLAIRNGQLIVRASALGLLTAEGSGSVTATGELDGNVRLHITDVGELVELFKPSAEIAASGAADIDLKLSGNTNRPDSIRFDGTLPQLALSVSGHQITAAEPIRFAYQNGRVDFTAFHLRTDESLFSIAGFLTLGGDKKLSLDLRGLVEAGLITLLTPDIHATGHVNVAAHIGGTLDKPAVTGTAELQNTDLKLAGFPQLISAVTGTVVFQGDRVEIDSLRAEVGGGTVIAGGSFTLNGLSLQRVRINLTGTDVSLRYFEGITLDGDFNLVLSGDLDRMVLQGDVKVNRALYARNFDLTTSVLNLLLERRGVLPAMAAPWQDHVSLRVHLDAPGTIAVRNNIADVTGTASLDVAGTLANPVVLGTVVIDEGGKVRFQDIDYRVVRGTINFQNPFRIDPYFDITAEGRLQEYDLTINLTGTLDHPHPVITSDPPAGDLTILSLVTGNVGPNGSGILPTQQAGLGLAGSSLLAKSLGQFLGSKILPFADAVRIEGAFETGSETTVTFEKRISRDVRVVITQATNSSRQSQLIEWQATPEWTLQLTHQAGAGVSKSSNELALDGRFRRRYEGRWGGGRKQAGIATASMPIEPVHRALDAAALNAAISARSDVNAGKIVASLDFRPDTNFDTRALPDLVVAKLGEPLSIRAVQDSIKALYATGDFRDIRVDAVESGESVALTFQLSVNYRLNVIELEGFGSSKQAAAHELRLRKGDVFSLSAVDRTALDLQQSLSRRGYLDATVDPEVSFSRAANRADVIFHATPGPKATVQEIVLEGNLGPVTAAELRGASRLKKGNTYQITAARTAAERMQRFLIRKGYRRADVRFLANHYDPATHTAAPHFRVEVGPKVQVLVSGVPRRMVRRWIPFGRSEAYSQDRLDRAHDRIVDELQRRGYFFATVEVKEREESGVLTVEFAVAPGKQFTLGQVSFEGNQKLSDRKIAEVVATQRSGGIKRLLSTLLRRPTGTTQRQLDADRDAIEGLYKLRGFTQARVEPARVEPTAQNTLNITFPIIENPQLMVAEVRVEGNEQSATKDLPRLQVRAGAPFNPLEVSADVLALQTYYGDLGNIQVQVTPKVDMDATKTEATVTYRIAEGPRVTIDQVIVRGNDYTRTSVLTRTASLDKGEPFSYRHLLEAQRNLQRLAIFQRVDIQPESANSTGSERNVVIDVAEGKNLTVAGALGFSTDQGARGSVSIAHRNLFGTGRYLGLDARVSQKQQRLFATYREPFTFGTSIPTQVTAYRDDDRRNGAEIHRIGSFVEASRVFLEQTRWSLRYEYRNVRCDVGELCTDLSPGTSRQDRTIRISSLTPTFYWDTRNDALNPSHGFFVSTSLEYAFPLLHADADFLKSYTQGSWYHPVSSRSVLVFSGRLGAIHPFNSPADPSVDPNAVPLSERFVGGGETSHRAFTLDTLGRIRCDAASSPNDPCRRRVLIVGKSGQILSVGGNGMAVLNGEYRFPLFGSLGGALFVDAGNVWGDVGDISLGDLRYGVGTGVRYVTPVGPIRFDVGYKLDAQRPLEDRIAFFLSLGFPF